jgi:molecular chaperone DnaK
VKIVVMQGDSQRADQNQLLGEFLLSGIPPAPKGQPDIQVLFSIDADGIVSVGAKDAASGLEQSITVSMSGGLSDDDLQRMISERVEYQVETRAEESAQELAYEVETLHKKVRDKLPVAEASLGEDEVNAIVGLLSSAKGALNSRDLDALRTSASKLKDAHSSLSARGF